MHCHQCWNGQVTLTHACSTTFTQTDCGDHLSTLTVLPSWNMMVLFLLYFITSLPAVSRCLFHLSHNNATWKRFMKSFLILQELTMKRLPEPEENGDFWTMQRLLRMWMHLKLYKVNFIWPWVSWMLETVEHLNQAGRAILINSRILEAGM